MIKATTIRDGRRLLVIGLSFGNLDRFRREPRDTYIKINGEEMGLPIDVLLFSGETEEAMAKLMPIGPDTKVRHG
jgi:hypothetical protein